MTLTRLTLVALLCATVATQPTSAQPAPRPMPSVALPPDLDRVLRDYEKAWSAADAVALAGLFTEDGFVLQPNQPPVRGRANLEARYRGQGGGALRLRALAWAADGAVGYVIGAYGYGQAAEDVGKFTLTLRRDAGGRWLIVSDMDNGNQPPRPTP